MSSQSLQRREGCICEGGTAWIVAAISVHNLGAQSLLTLEVIVKGALRHTGRSRDVLDAGAVKALFNQDFKPGVDDFLAYIRSGHERLNMTGRLICQGLEASGPCAIGKCSLGVMLAELWQRWGGFDGA